MAFVYWIHLKGHTDVKSQGYVGITVNSYKKRWCAHVSRLSRGIHSNRHLQNAWSKYDVSDFDFTVICNCDNDYAYWLENNLRPSGDIGWNIAPGGEATSLGTKQSEDTINKRRLKILGRKNTPETLKKMSDSAKGKKKSKAHCESISKNLRECPIWASRRSIPSTWLRADEIYLKIDLNKTSWGASKDFEIKHDTFKSIYNKIKSGWNPLVDDEYQSWKNRKLKEMTDVL